MSGRCLHVGSRATAVALALFTSTGVTAQTLGPGPLDRDQLKELARAPSTLSRAAWADQPFELTIAFAPASSARDSGPATWSYDHGSNDLAFSLKLEASLDGPSLVLDRLEAAGRKLEVLEPDGNARSVQGIRVRKLDAGFEKLPPGGRRDGGAEIFRWVRRSVEPGSVDSITRGSRVRFEGRVTGYPSVGASRCNIAAFVPQDDNSKLITQVTCAVGLSVDRLVFLDAQDREIAAWPPLTRPTRAQVQAASAHPSEGAPAGGTTTNSTAETAPPLTPAFPHSQSGSTNEQSFGDLAWVSSPPPEIVERFYPLESYATGRAGQVELSCLEIEDGSVVDCRVLSETPERAGFGRAALSLSRYFRFAPVKSGDKVLRARLHIPYQFSVID